MEQIFQEGKRFPVTNLEAGPCIVTQVKNEAKDGYWALQVGFGTKRLKNVSKSVKGHISKVTEEGGKTAPRFLREIRVNEEPTQKVGDKILVTEVLKEGDIISVSGISKGKGFAGGVKRYHFKGGPKTHGQSDRLRAPGSIGQGTTPGRVYKGKRMAGRMGSDRVTVKNLKVLAVNPETNQIKVSGSVPGVNGALIVITKINN